MTKPTTIKKKKKNSVHVIHHSERIKKTQDDHLKDVEKACDKIQHTLMIKILK